MWSKIDKFLDKVANLLFVAIFVGFVCVLTYKVIIGRTLLYKDYYENFEKQK